MRIALTLLLAYFIGAFPSAYLVGRAIRGKDILALGSGNMGTANALRVLGKLPGILVFLLDTGKGLLALVLAQYLGFDNSYLWWIAAVAVFGHIYPIYLGFRGGKGLATGLAVTAYLLPLTIGVFVFLWVPLFLWKRHVPTASSIAILGVIILLVSYPIIPGILGAGLILWRHWPETRSFWFKKVT